MMRMLAAMLLAGLLCQPAWSWRRGTTACQSGATSCRGETSACLAAQCGALVIAGSSSCLTVCAKAKGACAQQASYMLEWCMALNTWGFAGV